MKGIHSWSGLLFGWLLFAVFLTGTLTVFDNEITYWMQPELLEVSAHARDFNDTVPSVTESLVQVDRWDVSIPTDRPPVLLVKLQEKRTFSGQTINPVTGKMITFRDTQGGDFFYHFHYGLLFGWPGAWLVGIAAIVMLITLATGVCGHRWTFKDVMMIRLRPYPRVLLDAHNLTGILVIPFHLMIAVTGLAILWSIYMPVNIPLLRESEGTLPLLSVLHFARLGGSPMRWLYFIMGLSATVMIATGLVLWTTKRQKSQAGHSSAMSHRVVEILNVATMAGLPVAVGAFFWANRLLPMVLTERSRWEIRCFFIVWGLCLVHSLFRRCSIRAWRDQLYGSAFLLGALPLLNGLTTNSHLFMSVPMGQWAMAGVDLTGFTIGVLLGWAARRVGKAAVEISNNHTVSIIVSDQRPAQM
ncbi:MAG: PepSY-associated TM helix domain-containing protein [Nitrospira sp.]|nr:PepSY-associated TM helix domain-containing protein [Nitrospira sp.]